MGGLNLMKRYPKTLFWAVFAFAAVFFAGTALRQANAVSFAYSEDEYLDEEETDYTEEEYNAWAEADQETYPLKRGELLLEFMETYPESSLMPYIEASYNSLLYDRFEAQQYADLEILAEKWLQRNPQDMQTLAYLAKATEELGKFEKCLEYLQRIYELDPRAGIAYQIAQMARKLEKTEMYLQWTEKLLNYPEFESDVQLRFELMQFFINKTDIPKATEYAKKVITAAEKMSSVDEQTEQFLQAARRQAFHVIGANHYDHGNFKEAITAFRQAINAERYGEGFYWIGMSQWELRNVDEAMVSFAKAELLGGEIGVRAKDRLEYLYKEMHNQTLVGIDKVYRKAKEELGIA
jgi:tetratricopeptide (TPR) repeat protein